METPDDSDSTLVSAAAAFEAELATYARLGELFLKTPLNTLKHVERVNATLGELAESEQRLQDAGKQLIVALSAARQQQEQLSQSVIERAPAVKARNETLRNLMGSMRDLAEEAAKINQAVASPDAPADTKAVDVSTRVFALSEQAERLAVSCHESDFKELAEQAHALHQRLKAIGTKLQKAGGN